MPNTDTTATIDQLNSFLRGELSAVETYRQAIEKLGRGTSAAMLQQWKQSHEMRASLLREQIATLGGVPADSSGPWGTFSKLVEGGAAAFGEKTAIYALEEGENHGLRDYQADVAKLDDETRAFILNKILPEQKRTHDGVLNLRQRYQAS